MATTAGHIPVLLEPVLEQLGDISGKVVIDGTFGGGGYTKAFLDRGAKVYAFDRDPEAIARGAELAEAYGDRLTLIPARFGAMQAELANRGVHQVDAVVLDIGVSSFQIDDAARGFSFRFEGPLDMRMEQEGESAADVVNTYEPKELARIFSRYGEEKNAMQIARKIEKARAVKPLTTTQALADLVEQVNPKWKSGGRHPAMRVFQALRIHVNRELQELEEGLEAAITLLAPGGRLLVVTFHSLEDRITKQFMRQKAEPHKQNYDPMAKFLPQEALETGFSQPVKKAIEPTEAELEMNPRSRSARLRVLAKK